jgi:hypothetical protein
VIAGARTMVILPKRYVEEVKNDNSLSFSRAVEEVNQFLYNST